MVVFIHRSVMAAAKLARSSTLVALLAAAVLWTSCALVPAAMAEDAAVQPVSWAPPSAGVPSPPVDSSSAAADPVATLPATPAAAALPSSSPSTPAASTAADTAAKKFPGPNPGGEPYLPAAEVASALPVPTPEELPSAASLGFGRNGGFGYGGPGDECCGGGGYGWFGGPGGFGPGTYGYNGPLYWGAAPAGGIGSVAAANLVAPLVVACVSAAMLA